MTIALWWWKNEAGFETSVQTLDGSTGRRSFASLSCLYVACGLGLLQHVPGNIGGSHTVRKRIAQHADALKRVMPRLDGPGAAELVSRCQGRDLPDR